MCDKMAISVYILKIVVKDPFLKLQMRADTYCLFVEKRLVTNKLFLLNFLRAQNV